MATPTMTTTNSAVLTADADGVIVSSRPSFEALCDEGREAADNLDAGRWTIGRIAAAVVTHYGQANIDAFAIQIAMEKKRVYEYERVHKFYELSAPADFREARPTLRYSHYRMAMRLHETGGMVGVIAFLEEAAVGDKSGPWTIETAGVHLAERLGQPVPPIRAVFPVTLRQAGNGSSLFAHAGNDADTLRTAATRPGATVEIVVSYPNMDGKP